MGNCVFKDFDFQKVNLWQKQLWNSYNISAAGDGIETLKIHCLLGVNSVLHGARNKKKWKKNTVNGEVKKYDVSTFFHFLGKITKRKIKRIFRAENFELWKLSKLLPPFPHLPSPFMSYFFYRLQQMGPQTEKSHSHRILFSCDILNVYLFAY